MTHYEFTVAQNKRTLFILIPACFVLGGGFYYAYDTTEEIPYAIVSGAIAFLLVYMLLKTALYRVNVQGRTVYVRTWLGRRYQFTCWDIEKVKFVEHLQTKGPSTYQLRIRVAGRTVYVDSTLLNFDMLMEHFMKMYEERQFKPEALPVSVANTMYLYRWQAEEASNNPTE